MNFLKNRTKNQHFISQAEQKWNSLDQDKNKIYRFDKKGLEDFQKGRIVSISRNLSYKDLFTFKIDENEERYNFESLFIDYELQSNAWISDFIEKINNDEELLADKLYQIFLLKLMGFIRNPYNIHKVINTFESALQYLPYKDNFQKVYQQLISSNKDQSNKICIDFKVSIEEYERWLLIILLTIGAKGEQGENIIYLLAKQLFDVNNMIIDIKIFQYDSEYVLLPDIGFVELFRDSSLVNLVFNLTKNIFISYTFEDKPQLIKEITYFKVEVDKNNMEILKKYNSTVICQSKRYFFCSSETFIF